LLLLQPLRTLHDGSTPKSHTQVLAQDFMTTLETLTLKEKDEIETKFDEALETSVPRSNLQGNCSRWTFCQRCLVDTQVSVGITRILYQDLCADPSLHQ